MIYKLQRKFIIISTVSVFLVVAFVFGVILALNISSMNRNMDSLADKVSAGGGIFPGVFDESQRPDKLPPVGESNFEFINSETPFSTRHFTVFFNENGETKKTFTESIYLVTEEKAIELAKGVLKGNKERGWVSNYRYKIFSLGKATGVVFVDGSMSRTVFMQSTMTAGLVLLCCGALVLLLIIILSKRAVKPIAESYEKQRQFVTDANHELKTPLTLILANAEIAELELGKNEWLDDIRAEGYRMSELVNQLVALSRMDEEGHTLDVTEVNLGALVSETVLEFEALATDKGKTLNSSIDKSISCRGDESLLRRLVGILLDNAIKYSDNGGEINLSLHKGRKITLVIDNTYSAVDAIEIDRLFDRFYRADKARTYIGGYGIGLSMAKSIVEKHGGEIIAYKKDNAHIGFKVTL